MIQTRLKADYKEIVGELEEIMRKKNHDYGPDNIAALGVRGVYVRMWDKVARLKQLVWENQEPLVDDESDKETPMTTCKLCGKPMKAHGYRFCPSCRKARKANEHTTSSL